MMRCGGPDESGVLCNRCMSMVPTCTDHYDDAQCYMYETSCGTCVRETKVKGDSKSKEVKVEK
jgi:hypothetical protein